MLFNLRCGVGVFGLALALVLSSVPAPAQTLSKLEQLGKAIFFDSNLSLNANQSCASCHDPASGWTGALSNVNLHGAVYEGSVPGAFGDRKPPSSAYATQSPVFHLSKKGLYLGGNFWDGRATGEKLGNPAADQAQGPFLNPVEQALPTPAEVVSRVCASVYGPLFKEVWGQAACSDITQAYDQIALSIAAYEASSEVNAFSSKYDASFRGGAQLTAQERRGFALFMGKAKCSKCHPGNGPGALFTDFSYDNVGVPKNKENPVYSGNPLFVDEGLGGFLLHSGYPPQVYEAERGKVKVPTLRNADKRPYAGFVKAFGHNGYFKSLEEIVHFYNTRDALPTCPGAGLVEKVTCWPPPENPYNVNKAELGNLGLTLDEEAAIVKFLKTLSDGWMP